MEAIAKRSRLITVIHINSINSSEKDKLKSSRVSVFDISLSGIGFTSSIDLTLGFFYEFEIALWGNSKINLLIEIVRKEQKDTVCFEYGGIFIGLTKYEKWIIETYQLFQE